MKKGALDIHGPTKVHESMQTWHYANGDDNKITIIIIIITTLSHNTNIIKLMVLHEYLSRIPSKLYK